MSLFDFVQIIKKKIGGEKVLDVGCLASYEGNIGVRHAAYRKSAGMMVGVDINRKFLKVASSRFDNLHYLDILDTDEVRIFRDKFGTFKHVIATDVIEHLVNPGVFLDNIRILLDKDGSLYLTTPNCRGISWSLPFSKGKKIKINADHVLWFEEQTLTTMLKRCGYVVYHLSYCFDYLDTNRAKTIRLPFVSRMGRRIFVIVGRGI